MSSTIATIREGVSTGGSDVSATGELTTGGGGAFEHAASTPTRASTNATSQGVFRPPIVRTSQPLPAHHLTPIHPGPSAVPRPVSLPDRRIRSLTHPTRPIPLLG